MLSNECPSCLQVFASKRQARLHLQRHFPFHCGKVKRPRQFAIQQGQLVRVKVKIKPSHSLANIGGFNYKTWLNSKSIIATGYVVKGSENKLIKSNITYRQQLFNHYQTLLPKAELTSVLLALAFGSRAELNSTSWQVLQATGTSHLIAISGLHIG